MKLRKSKIIVIPALILLVMVALLIAGTYEKPSYDGIDHIRRVIVANGTAYAVTNSEKFPVLKSFTNPPEYVKIPEGFDVLWSEGQSRLYYGDGRKIISFNFADGSREVVWKYKDRPLEKHWLTAEYIMDDYLIVSVARGARGYSVALYMLDLNTGEASKLKDWWEGGKDFFGHDEEYLYYTSGRYIGRFSLSAHEFETLAEESGRNAMLIGDYIYYVPSTYDPELCRMPKSGGNPERKRLGGYELGAKLIDFAWDGETAAALLEYKNDKGISYKVETLNLNSLEIMGEAAEQPVGLLSPHGLILDDGYYYAYSSTELYKGAIK